MKVCIEGGWEDENDGGAASSSPSNAATASINKSHLLTREFFLMMTLFHTVSVLAVRIHLPIAE